MGTVRIPLSSRKYPNLYALIDEEDYELVSQYQWRPYVHRTRLYQRIYAYGRKKGSGRRGKTVAMHRLILGLSRSDPGVDHANHDGLDNRRDNIRLADQTLNLANARHQESQSGYRGVAWNKASEKWEAWIQSYGRREYLGIYERAEDAAAAYNRAALEAWGEFAHINEVPREGLDGDDSLAMSSRLGATLTGECAHCGEAFTYVRAGTRKRKHCSARCRARFNDARYRERQRAAKEQVA